MDSVDALPGAAARVVKTLTAAAGALAANPRIGERLAAFEPGQVRRLLVRQHELPCEIVASDIVVLRLWHTRDEHGVGKSVRAGGASIPCEDAGGLLSKFFF